MDVLKLEIEAVQPKNKYLAIVKRYKEPFLTLYWVIGAFIIVPGLCGAIYRREMPFWFWDINDWTKNIFSSIIMPLIYTLYYSYFFSVPYYFIRAYFENRDYYYLPEDVVDAYINNDWGGGTAFYLSDGKNNHQISFRLSAWIGLTLMFFHNSIFAFMHSLPGDFNSADDEVFESCCLWGGWIYYTFRCREYLEDRKTHIRWLKGRKEEFETGKKKFVAYDR